MALSNIVYMCKTCFTVSSALYSNGTRALRALAALEFTWRTNSKPSLACINSTFMHIDISSILIEGDYLFMFLYESVSYAITS